MKKFLFITLFVSLTQSLPAEESTVVIPASADKPAMGKTLIADRSFTYQVTDKGGWTSSKKFTYPKGAAVGQEVAAEYAKQFIFDYKLDDDSKEIDLQIAAILTIDHHNKCYQLAEHLHPRDNSKAKIPLSIKISVPKNVLIKEDVAVYMCNIEYTKN